MRLYKERRKDFTPAQSYAKRVIEAIDQLAEGGNSAQVQTLVMERPMTLRNALNNYLYKSINQRNNR